MAFESHISSYLREDLELIGHYFDKFGLTGSNILVTGTTGLIGSLIIRAIHLWNLSHKNKIRVFAIARDPQKVKTIFEDTLCNIDFVFQDLRLPVATADSCEYIIHAASPTTSKFFITNPVEVIDSIFTGSYNVLTYAKSNHTQKVVYLSSMEAYGVVNSSERVSEDYIGYLNLQNIRSCYPEAKRLTECLCYSFKTEYNTPISIIRLAQTFGAGVLPWENRVFAQFAKSVLSGKDIVLNTDGKSIGNYVYTRDAIKSIALLLSSSYANETYNVVNENSTMSIKDLAYTCINAIGNHKQSNVILNQSTSFINHGYAPKTYLRLSSSKIQQIGWEPEVDIHDSFVRMVPDIVLDSANNLASNK